MSTYEKLIGLQKMNYLISYPRSGNTWVRFILEKISGLPTAGIQGPESLSIDQPIHKRPHFKKHLENVNGDPIIYKAHYPRHIYSFDGKLILIARDPKECIVRHTSALNTRDLDEYMELIKLYDQWSGNKLLIYYEDLLQNPSETILSIVSFMDLNQESYRNFMSKYDYFFDLSVKGYVYKNIKSETGGKKIKFHQKKLTKQQIDIFNLYIEDKYQDLKNYINRYL